MAIKGKPKVVSTMRSGGETLFLTCFMDREPDEMYEQITLLW